MLGDYQGGVSRWIHAVTTPSSQGQLKGLFAMMERANKNATEGNSICNLGAAALVLRYLSSVRFSSTDATVPLTYSCMQPHHEGDSEFLVARMSKALCTEIKEGGSKL